MEYVGSVRMFEGNVANRAGLTPLPLPQLPQTFLYNQHSRSFRLLQHPPELHLVNLQMEAERYSETMEQSVTYKTV
jgi:hypothetical protein